MRAALFIAAALFVTGAGKPQTVTYGLRFGATPASPIGPPVPCAHPTAGHELCPYLEPDFVPNYEAVVPQAIRSCGASFVRFEPLTDGAERAFFDVPADRAAAAVDCIKKRVPNANIDGPNDVRL